MGSSTGAAERDAPERDAAASGGLVGERVAAPLLVLVLCALLVLVQLYVAIPLVAVLGSGGRSAPAAAALGTAYSLAYALGFLVFGPLSDRYGRKRVLVPGMAALALATAAVAASGSLGAVGAARAVQGLLASSFAAVALAYVGEAFPVRWRSTAVGAISTAFLVAGILGQVYAQAVAQAWGWRWVFGLAAPALGLAAVALAVALVEAPRSGPPGSLAAGYRGLVSLASRRGLALVLAAMLTVLLSFVAMYSALGPLLQTHFGLGHHGILLVRLAGLPGMALAPLAGWLAGRLGPARVAEAGFAVAALALVAEALASRHLAGLTVATGVFVAGIAMVVPASIGVVSARAGRLRGGALGLAGLALFVGASAGPLLAGEGVAFATLLLGLALLLGVGGVLVAASGRGR
jgi:YNFM family putative membrane transporter